MYAVVGDQRHGICTISIRFHMENPRRLPQPPLLAFTHQQLLRLAGRGGSGHKPAAGTEPPPGPLRRPPGFTFHCSLNPKIGRRLAHRVSLSLTKAQRDACSASIVPLITKGNRIMKSSCFLTSDQLSALEVVRKWIVHQVRKIGIELTTIKLADFQQDVVDKSLGWMSNYVRA